MIDFPRVSIVTPSFNQAAFLETTIQSVLNQNYPNLEYIIIDGGSTDGSVEIIKRYASQLAYWVSEPDGGQAHAINKGLQRATGEWVAWQNSDDIYYPRAFEQLAQCANKWPSANLIVGDINLIEADGTIVRDVRYVHPTYNALLAEGMLLANQASFWKRNMHERIGWLDENLHYCFDYEWFLRILEVTDKVSHIPAIMGALRFHRETKTANFQDKFAADFAKILRGRELPRWKTQYYRLRRLVLTLSKGHFRYVLRGVSRRSLGPHS